MAQWSRELSLYYWYLIPINLSFSEVIYKNATVCSQNDKGFSGGDNVLRQTGLSAA